jgi:hypothetical protein
MPRDFKSKIDQILAETGFSMNAINSKAGFGQGTLRAAYEANRELSPDKMEKMVKNIHINPDWWNTGKGDILLQKHHLSVVREDKNVYPEKSAKETFYKDLIESNADYSLIPRAVLQDYKIVPDKIIDVILSSNENEKKALEKSKDLEIESLNKRYELLIEGYENKIKRLEEENHELRGGKIPGKLKN